jgi:hypothetical protein
MAIHRRRDAVPENALHPATLVSPAFEHGQQIRDDGTGQDSDPGVNLHPFHPPT